MPDYRQVCCKAKRLNVKFSVIVPICGVEQYLNQCVESVLKQKFHDFELILVDDHSPDRCPEMCDAWAEKDQRIRVIHKEKNEGLGFARNTGMSIARGEYVTFLDSDDYISESHLLTCMQTLKTDTDILVFGIESVYENEHGKIVHRETAVPKESCAQTKEQKGMLFAQLSAARAFPFACNKVYRRQFLMEHRALFEKTRLIEDFLFNIELFEKAEKITAITDVLYYYRRPAHETLANAYDPEFFDLSKRKYALEAVFLEKSNVQTKENIALISQNYLKHIISSVIRNHSAASGLSWKQQIKRIDTMLSDPLTVSVMADYSPENWKYKIIRGMLCAGNSYLVMLCCLVIEFVQKKMLPLYRKLLKNETG